MNALFQYTIFLILYDVRAEIRTTGERDMCCLDLPCAVISCNETQERSTLSAYATWWIEREAKTSWFERGTEIAYKFVCKYR